jgi:hypothetical protein
MHPEGSRPSAVKILFLGLGAVVVSLLLYLLYLDRLFAIQDLNMEAMDVPLTAGYMEKARGEKIPVHEYFSDPDLWQSLKVQVPESNRYYGGRFHFEYFAYRAPLLVISYVPWVNFFGMHYVTLTLYSTFMAFLCMGLAGFLAWRMYGAPTSLISVALLGSALTWLIHTKASHTEWFPSVALFLAMVILIHESACRRRLPISFRACVGLGVLIGLLFLAGWIAAFFACVLLVLTIISHSSDLKRMLRGVLICLVAGILTYLGVIYGYAHFYDAPVKEILETSWAGYFGRLGEGSVPTVKQTLADNMAYTLRTIFWDMASHDHQDKAIPGVPSISFLHSGLFILGCLYLLRRLSPADRLLFMGIASVFVVVGGFYLYAHRYGLVVLPLMTIIMAQGLLCGLREIRKIERLGRLLFVAGAIVAGSLFIGTTANTYAQYYGEFLPRQKPSLETDRARGHFAFSRWLGGNFNPNSTLVVLSDPITFPHSSFLFQNWYRPFPLVYWRNYLPGFSSPEAYRSWETKMLSQFDQVIFAFSTMLIKDEQLGVINHFKPFAEAHPHLKPDFVYRYNDRILFQAVVLKGFSQNKAADQK